MATIETEGVLKASEERLLQQLRQEQETFNQHKIQESRWFDLRLKMGYVAVFLLVVIMAISSYILFNNEKFPAFVLTAAGAALFADVLGLLASVWKIVLNPDFMTKLAPVTIAESSTSSDESAKLAISNKADMRDLIIYAAKYGPADKSDDIFERTSIDVTEALRSGISEGKLDVLISNNLGGDPFPGELKRLEIVYSHAGKTYTKTISEGNMLTLP